MSSFNWPSEGGGTGTGNIDSINSDTTADQTLAVGTAGTDFAIVDNGTGTHTFNLPSASASARGAVTTGTQTIAGAKTFSSQPIVSTLSASQAVFSDSSKGLVSNAITGSGNVVMSASPTLTGTVTAAIANFSGNIGINGGVTGLVESFAGFLESPTDKTYILDQSAAYAYTINTIIVATASGTTTLAVKINGTNVTGISAVSVSSTPATGTATAANVVAVGNQVTLVLSSSSSPTDMGFTLKYTRS